MNLKELDLTGNPVTEIDNYREHIISMLPTLKSLDNIPVASQDTLKKGPLGLKRAEIEDVVGKFLVSKIAPNPKEISFDSFKNADTSPVRKIPSDNKSQANSFQRLVNQSRVESSKQNESQNKSMNYSKGNINRPPMVNLDNGTKNDQSGLFTFMYDKGIDSKKSEPTYALKEIINIQEEYIKKKSVGTELLKHWRTKVFELLFENKRSELLFNEKYKSLQKENENLNDELDNANYMKSVAQKELDSVKYELQARTQELESVTNSLKEKEFVNTDVNKKITHFESIKSHIKQMMQNYSNQMQEQESKINDGLFTLQSYHKRLQILQKRIKTYAQLCKSEQNSYIEKYRQLKRDIKAAKSKDNENFELKATISELKKSMEEKELTLTTVRHELKLEKGK